MSEQVGADSRTVQRFEPPLDTWSPGVVRRSDRMAVGPAAGLAATLGLPVPPAHGPLPLLWHLVYFVGWPAAHEVSADGHPREDALMPPLPERTRMFGGGRIATHRPLALEQEARRVSKVTKVERKNGGTGILYFVTVRNEISQDDVMCIVDEQDLVYRSGTPAPSSGPTQQPQPVGDVPDDCPIVLHLDPVLLFRFSALTANTHRIHYDHLYATRVEGYPGLLAQGPLIALMMAESLRDLHPEAPPRMFDFRVRRPSIVGDKLRIQATPDGDSIVHVAAFNDRGVAATATATYERHAAAWTNERDNT